MVPWNMAIMMGVCKVASRQGHYVSVPQATTEHKPSLGIVFVAVMGRAVWRLAWGRTVIGHAAPQCGFGSSRCSKHITPCTGVPAVSAHYPDKLSLVS